MAKGRFIDPGNGLFLCREVRSLDEINFVYDSDEFGESNFNKGDFTSVHEDLDGKTIWIFTPYTGSPPWHSNYVFTTSEPKKIADKLGELWFPCVEAWRLQGFHPGEQNTVWTLVNAVGHP